MHWRLQTFGVYYPDGKFHWQAFLLLLKQSPSYYRWLGHLDRLKGSGTKGA